MKVISVVMTFVALSGLLLFHVPDARGQSIIISTINPEAGGSTTLGRQQTDAVSWSLPSKHTDVTISAQLVGNAVLVGLPPITGTAYLTNQIGSTTTVANQFATATFLVPGAGYGHVVIFTGLTLEPGTYFLTLASTTDCCSGWVVDEITAITPPIVTALGVSYNGSYFSSEGQQDFNRDYPPASGFFSLEDRPRQRLQFDVTGKLAPQVIPVTIDIKPDDLTNSINPRSAGTIEVAILTTASFDVRNVNLTTVRFGISGTEAVSKHYSYIDIDKDGDLDLILSFGTQQTRIVCGITTATLTGNTFQGQPIRGTDFIRTTNCK